MIDVMMILIGLTVFVLLEHVPYWINVRKNFILRIENERLEVYLNLQKLCLESTFKAGQMEHDALIIFAEQYPTLPFAHVLRSIFDSKYRRKSRSNGRKMAEMASNMPRNARDILANLQSADICLVAVRYPVAFATLLLFVLFSVLWSPKKLANAENAVSELIVQKTPSCAIPALAT